MAEIALTNGQIAYVDDDDYELVRRYRWTPSEEKHTTYALSTTRIEARRTKTQMHQLLLIVGPGLVVHHDDGDGLNNRRANLFAVTRSFNQRNQRNRVPKTGYLGVYRTGRCKTWIAQVQRERKTVRLGPFNTPEGAAQARADYLAREIESTLLMATKETARAMSTRAERKEDSVKMQSRQGKSKSGSLEFIVPQPAPSRQAEPDRYRTDDEADAVRWRLALADLRRDEGDGDAD